MMRAAGTDSTRPVGMTGCSTSECQDCRDPPRPAHGNCSADRGALPSTGHGNPSETDSENTSQVAVEACLSFFFLLVGILWTAPTLKGVSYASEMSNRCAPPSLLLARDPC
jgi:hypothetical protein